MSVRIIIAGVLSLVLVGCGDEGSVVAKKPGLYVNEYVQKSILELADSDVVLVVNGEKLTKRDFDAQLRLSESIWSLASGKELPSEELLAELSVARGQWIAYELIHHALFRQYAKRMDLKPSSEQVKCAEREFVSSFSKFKFDSVASMARMVGGDAGDLMLKIPYVNAQDAMLRQSVTTNDLSSVSAAELEARRRFVAAFDANADGMNAKAKERLMEAKAEILAGGDFAEVTKKYAEVHPEYGSKWGTFILAETASEEDLHDWLVKAKVGDISNPVDTDDGMAIVKLVAKGKGDAPPGAEPPDAYTMVRCTVKACEKMRYQDEAEMKRQLLIWKLQDAQKVLGEKLMSEAVIEYPNGTNLFKAINKEK